MRHARFAAVALLTAATCTTTEVAAQADTPYLATIAIERSAGADVSLGATAVSTLHVNDPAKTVASLSLVKGIDVIASDEHSVRIRFDARPTLRGEPHETLRQSSWVVDYDEAPIRDLVAGFAAQHAATPTPAELDAAGIDAADRPEAVPVDAWVRLANARPAAGRGSSDADRGACDRSPNAIGRCCAGRPRPGGERSPPRADRTPPRPRDRRGRAPSGPPPHRAPRARRWPF